MGAATQGGGRRAIHGKMYRHGGGAGIGAVGGHVLDAVEVAAA